MNFEDAVNAALKSHKMKRLDLAQKAKTGTSNITRALNGETRPSSDLLKSLCSNQTWSDNDTGLNILRAWLEDEIIRAGRSTSEIDIIIHGDNPATREIEEQFRLIRSWLSGDPDVEGIIKHLGDTARNERDFSLRQMFNEESDEQQWHTLPCYGVAAGRGVTGDEWEEQFTRNFGDDYFALKVCGDSMEPDIKDGQIIVIRKTETLRTPAPRKGDIYCFEIDGERRLKRYNTRPATKEEIEAGLSYQSGRAHKVKVLESINPAFPEHILTEGDNAKNLGWYDPSNQPNQ